MLRVALLDDHPAVLGGLQRLIDSTTDLGGGFSDRQCLRELEGARPDVVVLDYDLARGDGLTLCQTLNERVRPPAVVIYSAYAGPGLAISSRLAGADALVDKRAPASERLAGAAGQQARIPGNHARKVDGGGVTSDRYARKLTLAPRHGCERVPSPNSKRLAFARDVRTRATWAPAADNRRARPVRLRSPGQPAQGATGGASGTPGPPL